VRPFPFTLSGNLSSLLDALPKTSASTNGTPAQ
jgi:hypothetical protein